MADSIRRFARLRTICEGALELPEVQRGDWVHHMCDGDTELLAEVEEILRRIDEGGVLANLINGKQS